MANDTDKMAKLVDLDSLLGSLGKTEGFEPGQIDRVRQIGEYQAAALAGITGKAINRIIDLDASFKTGPARPSPTKCPMCGHPFAAKDGS